MNEGENVNVIVRAFERNEVCILKDDSSQKTKYLFRAQDVANVLGLSNIRMSIQNFDSTEVVLKRAKDKRGAEQDTLFLTSHGVYHLLYTSKKSIAKKFRNWVGDILDDIIFNQSQELTKQLLEYKERVDELAKFNKVLGRTMEKDQAENENAFVQNFNGKSVLYLAYVTATIIKFGWTDKFKDRLQTHKSTFPQFKIAWVIECKENRRLERAIKSHIILKDYRTKMEINNVVHNELIELKNGLTFEDIRKIVAKLKEEVEQSGDNEMLVKQYSIEDQKAKNVSKALDLIADNTKVLKSLINLSDDVKSIDIESESDSEPQQATHQEMVPQEDNYNGGGDQVSPCSRSCAEPLTQVAQVIRDIQVTRESFPLPVFPPNIDDMCEFYNLWNKEMRQKFEAHIKRFKRPQWKKCFAKESSAHKLRYEKSYNWLDYLDTQEPHQVQQVIQLMTTFADENGLSHSSMVKQVFYLMVRPDSLKPKGFQGLCDDLLKRLKELNIEPPPNVVKQVHTYKERQVQDTNVTSETNEAVETSQADAS